MHLIERLCDQRVKKRRIQEQKKRILEYSRRDQHCGTQKFTIKRRELKIKQRGIKNGAKEFGIKGYKFYNTARVHREREIINVIRTAKTKLWKFAVLSVVVVYSFAVIGYFLRQ